MKAQSLLIWHRVLLSGTITLLVGTACAAQTVTYRQWKVKYESGTEKLAKGTKITLTIGSDTIAGQAGTGSSITIPVSSITEVSYDTVEKKRTKQGAALMAASPLAGLILMGTKSVRHYVNIISKENEQEREVIFLVGKGDREAFLAELQRVTGQPWHDRAAERKKTETELDHKKKEKISVQLDRKARVNDTELKPGLYQIVLLERQGNTGELYFFAGKNVNSKKSVADSTVDLEPQTSNITTAQVKYDETKGGVVITEIQTQSKLLRLRNQ